MRTVVLILFLSTLGCSLKTVCLKESNFKTITNTNLDLSGNYSHPLVCGDVTKDYPKGYETVFYQSKNKTYIHAVFPSGIKKPIKNNQPITLKGYYQSIQNKSAYKIKRVPLGYKYFIVKSLLYE